MNDTARQPQQSREWVDFASVPPSQWAIHDRLANWARWCHGSSGREDGTCRMFSLASSGAYYNARRYGEETVVPIDKLDAARLSAAIGLLPEKQRRAIHWYYVRDARGATDQARELGVSVGGLAALVLTARTMLITRET